jgi:hypothetical protein
LDQPDIGWFTTNEESETSSHYFQFPKILRPNPARTLLVAGGFKFSEDPEGDEITRRPELDRSSAQPGYRLVNMAAMTLINSL